MKKTLSLILAAAFAASALASCGTAPTGSASTASDYADEAWLKARLGEIPANVTVGTADSLGVDMADFEDDGYFIRTESGETVVAGKTADGLDRAVRRYAKAVKYGDPICDVTYHEGARIEKLTIAGRDIAEYTVVYTHTVEPVFQQRMRTFGNGEYAAKEFVRLCAEATGVVLPTVDLSSASVPAGTPVISFDAPEDGVEFGDTSFSYGVKDGDLSFRGSGLCAGCSNGVYYFFEHECGWKSLTYGDAFLEEAELVDIPEGTYHFGETMFRGCQLWGMPADHGIGVEGCDFEFNNPTVNYWGYFGNASHGMQNYRFCEFNYSTEQICYCDEERYEECRANVVKFIEGKLAAGEVIGESFCVVDLAHADNDNWCDCKSCRALFRKEGTESGAVVQFTNRLAEDLNETYPGLLYQLFAYNSTVCPPKNIKPSPLLHVTFCANSTCINHLFNSDECIGHIAKQHTSYNNTMFNRYLKRWCECTDNVYVWYYTMDGGLGQYNAIRNLYEDLNYFRSLGIKGFFLEGEFYGNGIGRMHFETCAALQWEPTLTNDGLWRILDEKAERYYGDADLFRSTAELILASHQAKGCMNGWRDQKVNYELTDYRLMAERIDGLCEKFDRVIEDAPSMEVERNCKRLSVLPIIEACIGGYTDAVEAGDTAKMAHFAELYQVFYTRAVECGYNMNSIVLGIACFAKAFAPTIEEDYPSWATE